MMWSFAASIICFWFWYVLYFGLDFNELGRSFDQENQVVFTDSAFVWGFPTLGFLLFGVIRLVVALSQNTPND